MNSTLLVLNSFNIFIVQNRFVLIGAGAILFVLILVFSSRIRKKKRKDKEERFIPPVHSIIGDEAERIELFNKDLAPFGFRYEPYQDIFYSLMNCWQRDFGYFRLYDEACAPLSMIIDCEPIYFEYGGKRWMIEFWKGQYGMTTGAEVGIYYTNGPDLNIPGIFNGTFYHCVKDEDRINMSFILRKNNNLLLTRSGYHWWLTGFKLGEFTDPDELSMDIMLELYNRTMANAFVGGLLKAGYKEHEFAVSGYRVYIHFNKPHTPQPITRTSITEYIMQKNNANLCNTYAKLTAGYSETIDKIYVVKDKSPNMYNQMLSFGKPKGVFDAYNSIKGSLNTTAVDKEEH
ncbi:MAG TPA: DUF4474 domain-containing protein [Clostridiales bacterium]|nr:DUF4474 domain-containing protein [Clostridiales bacterium]